MRPVPSPHEGKPENALKLEAFDYLLKANYTCFEQMTTKRPKPPDAFLPLTPVAFEILIAVAEEERHGYDIMVSIEERTDGRVSPNPGTLYRAIDRLVRGGLLNTAERRVASRGESRKHFRLSRLGRRVMEAELERLADQLSAARRLLKKPRGV